MVRRNWTEKELIVAFHLYCCTPLRKIDNSNPEIVEIAKLINRTPSAVSLKLANFIHLDPNLKKKGIKGLSHGGKKDKVIWDKFNNDWIGLLNESQDILLEFMTKEEMYSTIQVNDMQGVDIKRIAKSRNNQSFFRKAILASYDNKCCITGISNPALLVASHIIPWAKDKKNRMNPSNGLCLNALHDKAFDKGLLSVTPDFYIKLSKELLKSVENTKEEKFFIPYQEKKILLPQRFLPSSEFLEYHSSEVFLG
ncbi:MAG: HNH endonuclease [Balneolaceae bacterium]